ncbi:MAG: hypothetical protein H7Y32_05175, partial [Chloroflexales bacterium]|nr:hypothetical protein [Chloroflexales bacterium]
TQVRNLVSVPRVEGESTDGDNSSDAVLTVSPINPGTQYKALLPLVVK